MSTYYSPDRIASEWKAVESYFRMASEAWMEAARSVASGDIERMRDYEDQAQIYVRLGTICEGRAEAMGRDEIPEGTVV